MGNKRFINQTYFKVNNTNSAKVELLEGFLADNKYEYEQCEHASILYANEFYDAWKYEIESGVYKAMKRVPEEMTDDYMKTLCLDTIMDNEKDIMEHVVSASQHAFNEENDRLKTILKR